MKKVLSIVLSLAMVVCMMPLTAFAASNGASYSDIDGEKCEGAVNVLTALGVVDGYEDGTYRPSTTVTRAEMAKLIITALGVANYASAATSTYTDMANAQWAVPYVQYATNLNIINGYGNGKFGPSDEVTYEQAATMIVRALGFTDNCNEMNGSWPAIYVQKATALGLFNDVTGSGSVGANRGDIAIMLYNALTVPEVYADNDGQTNKKVGSDGLDVTMMDTLNVNGSSEYKIVTDADADTAVNSIAGYVGAAAEVIYNKDGDVLALSDIKTQFLTGKYKSNGKFEAENGTTYTIASDAYKEFDAAKNNGTVTTVKTGGVELFSNNVAPGETAELGSVREALKPSTETATLSDVDQTFTLAATVSGKTITGIYSIAKWGVTRGEQVDDSDINQIERNQKLLSQSFPLDDNEEIDTGAFILNGVDSLEDIAADNIVYVYTGNDEIKRIDVGTEKVSGTITKTTSTKVTIDGKSYEFSDVAGADDIGDVAAGDEVTLYLDYAGDIFVTDTTSAASGNFAVVTAVGTAPDRSSVASTSKIELLTGDGVKVFEVSAKDYLDTNGDPKNDNLAWAGTSNDEVKKGVIVQYALTSSGQIKSLTPATDSDYTAHLNESTLKITKSGYLDSYNISDSALIFAVPTVDGAFSYDDTDEISVVTKSSVLDSDVSLASYVVNNSNNRIVCLIMDDSATSDDQYGVVTAKYSIDGGTSADFYIGNEKITDGEVDSVTDTITFVEIAKQNVLTTVKDGAGLYKITKTTSGDYKFNAVQYVGNIINSSSEIKAVKNGYIEMDDAATTRYNLYNDVVVYVYDIADDTYSIGSTADLTDDALESAKLYRTNTTDSSDDNYNLVDYIVVTLN